MKIRNLYKYKAVNDGAIYTSALLVGVDYDDLWVHIEADEGKVLYNGEEYVVSKDVSPAEIEQWKDVDPPEIKEGEEE